MALSSQPWGWSTRRVFLPPRKAWCRLCPEVSAMFLRYSVEGGDIERSFNCMLEAKDWRSMAQSPLCLVCLTTARLTWCPSAEICGWTCVQWVRKPEAEIRCLPQLSFTFSFTEPGSLPKPRTHPRGNLNFPSQALRSHVFILGCQESEPQSLCLPASTLSTKPSF